MSAEGSDVRGGPSSSSMAAAHSHETPRSLARDNLEDDNVESSGSSQTATEETALLGNNNENYDPERGERKTGRDWDDLPALGDPNWGREAKMIIKSSAPLIITYFLQFSINATSVFAVGRLGKQQLGAVACESTSTLFDFFFS